MMNITCDKYSEYCWIKHMIETGYSNTFIGDDFCNKFEDNGWSLSQYVNYEESDIYYDDTPINKKGFHIIKNTEDK